MSQIVTRKGPKGEDKEKRQTDSPVKEMKKKIAANAEKEKQAAEKIAEKSVQSDKKAEKSTEKVAEKPSERKEKSEKGLDKSIDKKDKAEKSTEKNESTSDKKDTTIDKTTDKKEKPSDKTTEKKEKTSDKTTDKKEKHLDKKDAAVEKATDSKEKNGKMELSEEKAKKPETKAKENGAATNGEQNGDTVKAARTPETPRPASGRNGDRDYVPDDSKLLKLKDDALSTDRKLRSADSPKPQDKKMEKVQEGKKSESPKKDSLKAVQEEPSKPDEKDQNATDVEIEVVVEIENEGERRVKADTNFSKSRVKVSPYRRAREPADASLLADYTGNNSTMEMDITESSLDAPESPYLSGLRTIRARRSYRVLQEVSLRSACRPSRNELAGGGASPAEQPSRPTGTVVGRKRRPEAEAEAARGKRPRLLERLARPFRAAPPPARRAAEIVGINTDLPLSAPVAAAAACDPEAIKPQPAGAAHPAALPAALPAAVSDRDGRRCTVM
nr:neurofilament heavy polypeptide-like isoform X3 [Vanessa tameamea]